MKNKEIEELLNELKDKYSYEPYDTTGKVYTTISYEEGQLLLSHIEQLEQCYCNRTDCSSRIKDSKKYDSLLQKYEQLEKENKILRENAEHNDKVVDKVNWKINVLKHNRDKALKFIKENSYKKGDGTIMYDTDIRELENIIKGDSDV